MSGILGKKIGMTQIFENGKFVPVTVITSYSIHYTKLYEIRKMKLKFEVENPSTDRVLKIRGLAKSFGGESIFENVNLELYRGDRVGLIGKNGVGKSTILT